MKAGTPGQHPEPSRESLSSHHLSSERGETNCPLSAPNPGMMHRDQALLPSHSQHPSTASHHSPQARSSREDLELLSCTFCSWHFWLLFVLNPSDEKIKYWPCWFWVLAEPTDLHRAAVTGGYGSVCHVQMCSESPGKVELLNKGGELLSKFAQPLLWELPGGVRLLQSMPPAPETCPLTIYPSPRAVPPAFLNSWPWQHRGSSV